MNIGIDIDGVLTNLEEFMKNRGQEYFKKPIEDESGDEMDKLFGVSREERVKFWNEEFMNYATTYPLREDAKSVIQKLRSDGHKIFIITARRNEPAYGLKNEQEFQNATKDMLERNGITYDGLYFAPSPKLKKARELKIDLFVEDNTYNASILSQFMKVAIMDSSYNRTIDNENIIRISSFQELYKKVAK